PPHRSRLAPHPTLFGSRPRLGSLAGRDDAHRTRASRTPLGLQGPARASPAARYPAVGSAADLASVSPAVVAPDVAGLAAVPGEVDRKSTRLNSSHVKIS